MQKVCDNQRWAIDKGLGGKTVYHLGKRPERAIFYPSLGELVGGTYKDRWNYQRGKWYASAAKYSVGNGRHYCEV